MTTSSTNNSVFRGFFEKQKLTVPNFIDWYRQLRIVLSNEDKLNYLEQPIPSAPVAPAASIAGASSYYERFSLLQAGRRANYNMHNMRKTVNELHAMLSSMSKLCPKETLLLLMLFELIRSRKPKIPPPPKRENLAKDSICHECGEIGHWKRSCPQYLAELMKKKKNTTSGASGS
nr:zinc finger, CCHC-type [Tanacetum cinerariifolium]